ncbi:MAG: YciI family protein [Bacteroidales bacterium]|jgi:uncharacterized protein YciI|nr:YciI family protein [Bacteroidales bacterium]MCU0407461.1 YciI family protein [Bacteroidales bacterium]
MRGFIRIFLILVLLSSAWAGTSGQKPNPDYDSTLVRKLGADERGMKMYVLVILRTGPNNVPAGARRDSLFRGHFSNMDRLAEAGKLVLAGPFDTNESSWRGLFIFNVPTVEEAKELVKTDPTVKERIFEVDFYRWYGSAAISEYMPYDKKLKKSL